MTGGAANTPDLAGLCERLRARNKLFRLSGEYSLDGSQINPDGPEAAAAIERLVADNERYRNSLTAIQREASREQGRWVHLKRVIAIHTHTALEGASDDR
jgi:hypothetical protein